MSGHARLLDLLPSLYRPEPEDETLLNRLLGAAGFSLDGAALQIQHVLRAHWFDTADAALWDAHDQTARSERGLGPANVRDAKDLQAIRQYPYVTDLARLCALLDLPHWREPAALREGVEEYRQRVQDLLAAYRLGLTTVPALRRLVEAALPEAMGGPLAQERWPFAIEEPVALRRQRLPVTVANVQEGDLLTPLHRWSQGGADTAPVVYVQGVTPDGDRVAATEQPALEYFTPGRVPAGMAIAYRGTLAPGETLRLAPARRSWLLQAGALAGSPIVNLANADADPSANGPWTKVAGAPAGTAHHLAAADDGSLWLTLEDGGAWHLWRFDGGAFMEITQGAPAGPFTALLARSDGLYLGSAQGLFRCPLYPGEGAPFALAAVAAVPEAVRALRLLPDGRLAAAGADGLALLDDDDALSERLLPGVALQAVHGDRDQLYLATGQALLLRDHDRWFRYEGAQLSEQAPDWQPLAEADIADAVSSLPAVTALATTADGSLWIGTARGLARYRAANGQTTLLEAFPDLGGGAVASLAVDERGLLWAAGADGLFRFDGRDLAQYRFDANRWEWLGEAGQSYPDEVSTDPRGHWRFATAVDRWERFDTATGRFAATDLAARKVAGPALSGILFTASVSAALGQFDGTAFTPAQAVDHDQLVMRIKPDETRIVAGGLPALPADTGGGLWRYLQLEPPGLTPPAARPWWSREGRLFLPPPTPAPWPGHFRDESDPWHSDGHYDGAIFAYPPSARLWLERARAPAVGVRVRLFRRTPDQVVDPAIVERVWQLLVRAKAAGVPLELALEGTVLKGDAV